MFQRINILILVLLLWMPLTGVVNNLTDSSMALLIGRIYRLLNIVLLLCVIYKSSFKSIVKQRAAVIIVAAIYLLFFHYETNINPPLEVKGLKGLVYSTNSSTSLMYHLMFALSVSIYMQKQTMMFDKIISKFVVYSTIANAILVIVMLSKYGVEFFLVGALSYNGVTLIGLYDKKRPRIGHK